MNIISYCTGAVLSRQACGLQPTSRLTGLAGHRTKRQPSKLYGYANMALHWQPLAMFVHCRHFWKVSKIDCAQLSKCKWLHKICLLFLSSFQQQTGRAHWKNCVGLSCPNLSPMELQIFQQLLCGNNLLRNLAHLIKLLGSAQLSRQPTDAGVAFPLQENLTQDDRWHVQFKARDSKSPK